MKIGVTLAGVSRWVEERAGKKDMRERKREEEGWEEGKEFPFPYPHSPLAASNYSVFPPGGRKWCGGNHWKSPRVIVRFCRWCWLRKQKTVNEGSSLYRGNTSLLNFAKLFKITSPRPAKKEPFCRKLQKNKQTKKTTHKWVRGDSLSSTSVLPSPPQSCYRHWPKCFFYLLNPHSERCSGKLSPSSNSPSG